MIAKKKRKANRNGRRKKKEGVGVTDLPSCLTFSFSFSPSPCPEFQREKLYRSHARKACMEPYVANLYHILTGPHPKSYQTWPLLINLTDFWPISKAFECPDPYCLILGEPQDRPCLDQDLLPKVPHWNSIFLGLYNSLHGIFQICHNHIGIQNEIKLWVS